MYTFGQLQADIRAILWPAGEQVNLVTPHNQFFLDALIDLQTWVECLQYNHVDLFPQCSTFYNCGLTTFPAPRGRIKKLSIIGENSESESDWCGERIFSQREPWTVQQYFARSRHCGHSLPTAMFFAFPCRRPPVPTDEGLPAGLAALPLGYHYPQTSTDRKHNHRESGIWAIERGTIYLAPWLQSTDTVIVKWDGIKRSWATGDPVDQDPLLQKAVLEYVRWQQADKFDKDDDEADRASQAYDNTRAMLMHECREQNRVRGIEPSFASGAPDNITTLYYNEQQVVTVDCPGGTSGNSVVITVPAATVSSTISVADANTQAIAQAQIQGQTQLNCQGQTAGFTNTPQSATAACTGDAEHPQPDGTPVTVTIPAGTITSTVSGDDANSQAMQMAITQANAALVCTFWNSEQTYTATCETDPTNTNTQTIAAHTYSSTTQADADALALTAATNAANVALALTCGSVFWNTEILADAEVSRPGTTALGPQILVLTVVTVRVPAHNFSGANLAAANLAANAWAQKTANAAAAQLSAQGGSYQGGSYLITYPSMYPQPQ